MTEKATRDTINMALAALRRSAGLEGQFQRANADDATATDGHIVLTRHNVCRRYEVEWKSSIRSATALTLARAKSAGRGPRLLVTQYLTPYLANQCKEIGLQFIDTAGNAHIDADDLYIFVSGQRPDEASTPVRMHGGGNPTAQRMIFALLCRPSLLQASYREIAQASGIALGSVGSVFNELAERGWLVEAATAARRRLTAPDRLLDEWVANYPTILRPRLHARRFAAPHPDWWQDTSLAELKNVYWGGEVAAEKMTAYLRPETQTLYVVPGHMAQSVKQLVQTHRLRPHTNGPIEILDAFWEPQSSNTKRSELAPAVLVYADLMASLSSRNLEVAAKIRKEELQHVLDQF
ncbi:type IV toxin-antitoxin system AbiEi family antitoxin [Cupriavidus sp. UYPR2.512]|uniref:type IV toxin-antitoxin system AbiEi family antitoxin n=1 Tax=Cupriavidus sp. UYPR2.512 TaxID=1080187 RepID=UPI00035EBECF|nr:type IV toxin-antitoxin system AbiEi family antitoxin [Cupriavidus sp. UYPR2.512]UIF88048.1 hypothetical protein KAF44_22675 [Cupriavidus necator]